MKRDTFIERDVSAGCTACDATWKGSNAQAVAARHHDATQHRTWVHVAMGIHYGRAPFDDRQTDIEDAIASASSGDAPGCAPLPDFDAPAVPAAGVSAPEGRSSKPALAAAKPEHTNP